MYTLNTVSLLIKASVRWSPCKCFACHFTFSLLPLTPAKGRQLVGPWWFSSTSWTSLPTMHLRINPSWHKGKNIKWRLLLEDLGEALVAPFMKRCCYVARTPASQNMVMEAQACSSRKRAIPLQVFKSKVMEARACSSTDRKPGSSPVSSPSKRKRCQVCESKKSTKTSMMCNMYIYIKRSGFKNDNINKY